MTVTPKLLMLAGIVLAIPLTLNVALSTQVLRQQAAMISAQPVVTSGCYYKPNRYCTLACPTNNPYCCPPILVCPSGTPSPTCTPLPPQCQPGSHLGIACPATPPGGWCSPTITPVPPTTCSDCPSGFNLCRNNSTGATSCVNPALGINQGGNISCTQCPVITAAPTPTPPAGCFYKTDYRRCPLIHCSGASCNCPQILVCPQGVPHVSPINAPPCTGENCPTQVPSSANANSSIPVSAGSPLQALFHFFGISH